MKTPTPKGFAARGKDGKLYIAATPEKARKAAEKADSKIPDQMADAAAGQGKGKGKKLEEEVA